MREIGVRQPPFCPLCGRRGETKYRGLRDRFYGVPGSWSLCECNECLHLWLDPRPLPSETWKLYSKYYTHQPDTSDPPGLLKQIFGADFLDLRAYALYPDLAPKQQLSTLGSLLMRTPFLRSLADYASAFAISPNRGQLLDVGCGDGRFLARMRSFGWKVMGIDPDPVAAELARQRFDLEVLSESVDQVWDLGDRFDLVMMNHVIEHLPDPWNSLARCWSWVREGGRMIVITPNAQSIGRHRYGRDWMHLDPPRHFHLFSPESLMRTFAKAGIGSATVRTSSMGAPRSFEVSERLRSREDVDLFSMTRRVRLRARVFQAQELLQEVSGCHVGEELVAICHKTGGNVSVSGQPM